MGSATDSQRCRPRLCRGLRRTGLSDTHEAERISRSGLARFLRIESLGIVFVDRCLRPSAEAVLGQLPLRGSGRCGLVLDDGEAQGLRVLTVGPCRSPRCCECRGSGPTGSLSATGESWSDRRCRMCAGSARKLEVSHVSPCLRSERVTTHSDIAAGSSPVLSASCRSCAC